MDRLTEETQLGPFASLKDKAETRPGAFHDYDCLYAHMVAVTRLKAYEDTGLEPSEINDSEAMFTAYRNVCGGLSPEEVQARFDDLARYREAEADGRLIVLPAPLTTEDVYTIKDIGRIVNNLDFVGDLLRKAPKKV